jgi:hypothetical protein
MPVQPVSSTNPVATVAHDVVGYWDTTHCKMMCPVNSHMITTPAVACPMPVGATIPMCHMPVQPATATSPVTVAHDVVGYWDTTHCKMMCPVNSHMITTPAAACPMPTGTIIPMCHMPAQPATATSPVTVAHDIAGYWDAANCKIACPVGSHMNTTPGTCAKPTTAPPMCHMPVQPVSSTNPVATVAHDVAAYWAETSCSF